MTDLVLRPLGADDERALTDLARECDETYLEWTPPGWMIPVAPPGWADKYFAADAWILGAFDGSGRLVGTVAFRPADEEASLAHVGLVFVHPSRWREGIAGRLLDLAETEMRAQGYLREQLWTPDGAPAEHFYRARGWQRDGRRHWHPWVGLELVAYVWELE